MSVKTSIELISEQIGFDIAMSDDKVQADLLNGLGRGFNIMPHNSRSMQISYLIQHLSPQAKQLIKELNDYLNDGSRL